MEGEVELEPWTTEEEGGRSRDRSGDAWKRRRRLQQLQRLQRQPLSCKLGSWVRAAAGRAVRGFGAEACKQAAKGRRALCVHGAGRWPGALGALGPEPRIACKKKKSSVPLQGSLQPPTKP